MRRRQKDHFLEDQLRRQSFPSKSTVEARSNMRTNLERIYVWHSLLHRLGPHSSDHPQIFWQIWSKNDLHYNSLCGLCIIHCFHCEQKLSCKSSSNRMSRRFDSRQIQRGRALHDWMVPNTSFKDGSEHPLGRFFSASDLLYALLLADRKLDIYHRSDWLCHVPNLFHLYSPDARLA